MDVSGDVADLMVKEGIQLTEESIKLLAAGSKNLTAFLFALAQDNKKLVGKTHMARLLRECKELKVFHIKESDLPDFRAFAKKNLLYAVVKDKRMENGIVDLVTNVDFVSQVNHFLERRGYTAPARGPESETPKKAAPRAPHGNSSPERGSGSTPSQTRPRTRTTTTTPDEKPSVKGRLAAIRAASESAKSAPQHVKDHKPKTR